MTKSTTTDDLRNLFKNYIKIAEVMLNTNYRDPKSACRVATEFHKLFDKYGNRPKLLLKEIQKNHQIDLYILYVNYLKDVRKEYLRIREKVDHPWTAMENEAFNEMYYRLMTPECERVLIKYNFADPNKYVSNQEQLKANKDVEKAVLEVEEKAIEYLKSKKKLKKYSEIVRVIRPQLYTELFDLRSELSDQRFKEEVDRLKCVDAERCSLTSRGQPKIRFVADSISTVVSEQIIEIVDMIICQNEDFRVRKDNHYGIDCGRKLSNIHSLVEDIIEREYEESKSPTFDNILKEVLRTILEPKSSVKFGKLNSIKEYRSIKNYLKRSSKKKSNFGRKRNPEEFIFERIIDFAILFGVVFFIGKYGGEFMKQIADLWLEGEETRSRQLDEERRRQQRMYERRREEEDAREERRREEDHQRRMLEFEASDRRFKEFRNSLLGQISDPALDFEKQSEVGEVMNDLKYDGPNKMLEVFLEPSEYTARVTRKKGFFKPSKGGSGKKGLFKPGSHSSSNIPVSEKLIQSLVQLFMERFGVIVAENEALFVPTSSELKKQSKKLKHIEINEWKTPKTEVPGGPNLPSRGVKGPTPTRTLPSGTTSKDLQKPLKNWKQEQLIKKYRELVIKIKKEDIDCKLFDDSIILENQDEETLRHMISELHACMMEQEALKITHTSRARRKGERKQFAQEMVFGLKRRRRKRTVKK